MNENILVVEDDQALRDSLSFRLRDEGYIIHIAQDGVEGLQKATDRPFDLIILDVRLPYRNGFEVCRLVRENGLATPILMLTVKDQLFDKVLGLNLGADDYVTKPFETMELIARIQAILRRVPVRSELGVVNFSSIRVDVPRSEVTRDGKRVDLTRREFDLLCYLIERAGATVSRTELLRSLWGYEGSSFTRTVDVHVSSLRKKLEENPERPELIRSIHGVGYKFVESNKK